MNSYRIWLNGQLFIRLDLDVPHIVDADPMVHMLHHTFPTLVDVSAIGASDMYEYDEREWKNIPRRLRGLRNSYDAMHI
jgi:hypothetical protein